VKLIGIIETVEQGFGAWRLWFWREE